jgi:hypothetical protein
MARARVFAKAEVLNEARLSLTFQGAAYEPQTLLGMAVAENFPPLKINFRRLTPVGGYIDNTFVDSSMRIARSASRDVFVLVRP